MKPGRPETVGDVGEVELVDMLKRLLASDDPSIDCGPGDDAAIVRLGGGRMVLTSDSQREGVHYRPDWISAADLGRRALAVSVSDLAAMGSEPVCALCTMALPASTPLAWLEQTIAGLAGAAVEFACPVVGGDVSRASSGVSIEISAVGSLPNGRTAMLRSGAQVGHGCWVTGVPGLAAAGRTILQRSSPSLSGLGSAAALAAYRRPTPPLRFAAAVSHLGLVAAAMDVSDGLAIDAARMCRASGTGLRILSEALVPPLHELALETGCSALEWALGGGDDYQLLCAVRDEDELAFQAEAQRFGVKTQRVGTFVESRQGVRVTLADGSSRPLGESGWDHFAGRGQ